MRDTGRVKRAVVLVVLVWLWCLVRGGLGFVLVEELVLVGGVVVGVGGFPRWAPTGFLCGLREGGGWGAQLGAAGAAIAAGDGVGGVGVVCDVGDGFGGGVDGVGDAADADEASVDVGGGAGGEVSEAEIGKGAGVGVGGDESDEELYQIPIESATPPPSPWPPCLPAGSSWWSCWGLLWIGRP